MKFSFSTNAFRKYGFTDAVKAISRAGYEGVEIMCDSPHAWPDHLTDKKVEEIKALVRGQNLSIANLNAFMMCEIQDFHHPSWIEPAPDFRRFRIEYTKKCIRLAAVEDTGYREFITLELYPYLDTPEETAVQARGYLKKVCGYA